MHLNTKGLGKFSKYIDKKLQQESLKLSKKIKNEQTTNVNNFIISMNDVINILNKKNNYLLPKKDNNILIGFNNFSNFEYIIDSIKRNN